MDSLLMSDDPRSELRAHIALTIDTGPKDTYELADTLIKNLRLNPRFIDGPNGKRIRCYQTPWELCD